MFYYILRYLIMVLVIIQNGNEIKIVFVNCIIVSFIRIILVLLIYRPLLLLLYIKWMHIILLLPLIIILGQLPNSMIRPPRKCLPVSAVISLSCFWLFELISCIRYALQFRVQIKIQDKEYTCNICCNYSQWTTTINVQTHGRFPCFCFEL
jgi:hypothetical protein